jgi:predicted nucleotidyltransferase
VRERYLEVLRIIFSSEIFGDYKVIAYFCRNYTNKKMKTTKEYIDIISAHADELRSLFGIRSLRLFGSVSRGEHKEGSDVDVCVEMEPEIYLVVRLKRFLEKLLQCSVDVVRMHKHMNPYLLKDIERDGIYVIQ